MPKIIQFFLDNYGGSADQLDCNQSNLQLTVTRLTTGQQLGSDTKGG